MPVENGPKIDKQPNPPEITGRLVDVLQMIANGLTNAQTAEMLNISEESVKTYVVRALEKLYANNRAHAVAIALRKGLIE